MTEEVVEMEKYEERTQLLLGVELLQNWFVLTGCSVPAEAAWVLVHQGIEVFGPAHDAAGLFRRGLEVLAHDGPLLVCLDATPGELDLFSQGAGYVAALGDASRNLFAQVDEAGLDRLRAAARSQLEGLMLMEG